MSHDYDPTDLLNEDFAFDGLEVGVCPPDTAVDLPACGSPVPHFFSEAPVAVRPSSKTSPWDPRLVVDLALEIDAIPTILERYGLTEDAFNTLSEVPAFRRELALTMREVREDGLSFASKARVQAETYLEELDRMVYAPDTPAGVRLDCIKSVVTWGRLLPQEAKQDTTNATQVVVNINI
jgi:hypothetical protein